MSVPRTEGGYNMFDMLSMLQKSIRRNDYQHAGFAAQQLKGMYRAAMWNRLFVISSEDCYGVVTKELVALREKDREEQDDLYVTQAVALLCSVQKSRDACYFACNFVLAVRKPRVLKPSDKSIDEIEARIGTGERKKEEFEQLTLFDCFEEQQPNQNKPRTSVEAELEMALDHRDMDMIGYEMDRMRKDKRERLWEVLIDYAEHCAVAPVYMEVMALKEADDVVNGKKSEKDEIFISKAAMLLCYANDEEFCQTDGVMAHKQIDPVELVEWSKFNLQPISECKLATGKIPEWVFDCHTLEGRKKGKTDWDMTSAEGYALVPKRKAYFDEASWVYTYEDDYYNHRISYGMMSQIWRYGETHEANPVRVIPYDEDEVVEG